jgi:hypothetical protein
MVLVYSRAPHDIIVRYAPNGQHKLLPNQSINLNLPSGTEVFATKDRDQSTAYARLLIRDDTNTLYFSETGGGYGVGEAVESQSQPVSDLSFWEPKSLAGDGRQAPPEQFAAASDVNRGAPLAEVATAQEQSKGGLIEVPGMGWMDSASLPPHILAQLQQRQQQQQPQQQQYQQQPVQPAQYRKPAMNKYTWLLPLGILAVLVLALLWTFFGKKFFRL